MQNWIGQITLGNNGRLGNQLFQYAALKSLSVQKSIPMFVPLGEHRLRNFRIRAIEVPIQQLNAVNNDMKQYVEPFFHFDPNFFNCEAGTNIHGYFQSEKYFEDVDYIIRRELKISDGQKQKYVDEYIENIKNKFPSKKIVSLHIRRGDNVPTTGEVNINDKVLGSLRPDKENFHPLLSDEYINTSRKMFDNCVFLVFSDSDKDIQWCKDNIEGGNLVFSEKHDDITDFALMSKCDHNIIANSSYSWWAAWLNENPDKVVVAPKSRWFGSALSHHKLDDLFPKKWVLL